MNAAHPLRPAVALQSAGTGGATTHYVWDEQNLLAELDGELATQAQYTDFPGQWGGLSAERRGSVSRFHVHDLSQNTRALTEASEADAARYLYSAFGAELRAGAAANPFRFGGQSGYYRDSATEVSVRARRYAPRYGRWVSRDPLGMAGEEMLYVYVSNGPVGAGDPSGLFDPFYIQYRAQQNCMRTCTGARNYPAYCQWVCDPTNEGPPPAELIATGANRPASRAFAYDPMYVTPPSGLWALVPVYGSGRMAAHHLSQGHYVRTMTWGLVAVSDLFLVKDLGVFALRLGRLAFRGLGAALTADVSEVTARAAKASYGALRHFTSAEGLKAIKTSLRLRGQYGLFALSKRLPSWLARVVTFGARSDAELLLRAGVPRVFAPAPVRGIIGLLRRVGGVVHSPLGTLALRESAEGLWEAGEFTSSVIQKTGLVHKYIDLLHLSPLLKLPYIADIYRAGATAAKATSAWDYILYLMHTSIVDYLMDYAAVYGIPKAVTALRTMNDSWE